MNEPIELTIGEQQDAIEALRRWTGDNHTNWEQAVLRVMKSINDRRAGDPVGTLRRHSLDGTVYERALHESSGRRYWRALTTFPTFGIIGKLPVDPSCIDECAVIYSPEAS